jgi:uncharacterized membrane protein
MPGRPADPALTTKEEDMTVPIAPIVTVVAIVGAGLMAGIYYTFSTFTMAGLRRLPPEQGAAAMQAVNIEAVRPALMSVFFGTALAGIVLYALAIVEFDGLRSVLSIAGATLYISSIVITAVFNVPLNDRLAAVDPTSSRGLSTWSEYQRRWTRGNHVRMAVSVAAAVVLVASLVL